MDRRIARDGSGGYRLELPIEERELLRSLPEQLRALLQTDDPSLRRLFPPAYEDAADDAEYDSLVREGLRAGRLEALTVVERTIAAERLDESELLAWLDALESLRLVLGTQLEIREESFDTDFDPSDPRSPGLALYGYLSWLQEQAVEALAAGLP